MEYLKKDRTKANHFRTIFERTPSRSLTDCYCKPSHTKKQIWNAISLECAMNTVLLSKFYLMIRSGSPQLLFIQTRRREFVSFKLIRLLMIIALSGNGGVINPTFGKEKIL